MKRGPLDGRAALATLGGHGVVACERGHADSGRGGALETRSPNSNNTRLLARSPTGLPEGLSRSAIHLCIVKAFTRNSNA